MQNVIFTGNTCFLWQNHVLHVFLRWIQYYKHCLPIKALSVRDFSVFSHLGNLGPLQWKNIHIRSLERNFEKIREFHWKNLFITYFCTDSSSFVKVFPMKIALVCDFALYVAYKRFISCNSDNSVQNVIFTGNTCFLWQNHVVNVFLRWIQYYKHCLPMKAPSVRDFSVFSHLGKLDPLQWTNIHMRSL